VVNRTGAVGHKSLITKRLVVESLSNIETSIFKALLTYHFLMMIIGMGGGACETITVVLE